MLFTLLVALLSAPIIFAQNTTNCTPLPTSIKYAANAKLPDPFLSISDGRITQKAQWECRKQEIRSLLQRYEYGILPTSKPTVKASLSGTTLSIVVTDGGNSITFAVTIKLPTSGNAPYPAIITYGGSSIPIPNTVATITYQNFEMAADNGRGKGKFYDLYGANHNAGGMIAAAWGVDRIMDALEQVNTRIDPKRVGVTGCSRNGKGAAIAGAFVDRIALSLPQEGGQGSAGCWRIADEIKKNGTTVETAHQIVNGDSWYSTEFSKYVDTIPTMPWDGHFLHALYASPPRGLLFIENGGIDYLGPTSNYHCATASRMVHRAFGIEDYLGFSQVSHSDHCGFPSASQADLTAFINKFLLKQDVSTNIFKTDGKFTKDPARWIDWTVPVLS